MAPSASARMIGVMRHKLALLLMLCSAAIFFAAPAAATVRRVDTFSYPAFDAATTQNMVAANNLAILSPASLIFDHGDLYPEFRFNTSEGLLLLLRSVDVWRAGGPDRVEASLNTSFTLGGAAPVAFVVLLDRYPTLNSPDGLRGNSSSSDAAASASSRLAAVEVGAVRSYGPENTAVGLNVTVTPNDTTTTTIALWIEYDAAAHRLSVYVAGTGEPRPANALLNAPLDLAGRTTEIANVGFFAGRIRDIIDGVRDWELTVDRLQRDGKKRTSWWVILLAVLGSVAGAAAIVTAVVSYFQSRRRRQLNLEAT